MLFGKNKYGNSKYGSANAESSVFYLSGSLPSSSLTAPGATLSTNVSYSAGLTSLSLTRALASVSIGNNYSASIHGLALSSPVASASYVFTYAPSVHILSLSNASGSVSYKYNYTSSIHSAALSAANGILSTSLLRTGSISTLALSPASGSIAGLSGFTGDIHSTALTAVNGSILTGLNYSASLHGLTLSSVSASISNAVYYNSGIHSLSVSAVNAALSTAKYYSSSLPLFGLSSPHATKSEHIQANTAIQSLALYSINSNIIIDNNYTYNASIPGINLVHNNAFLGLTDSSSLHTLTSSAPSAIVNYITHFIGDISSLSLAVADAIGGPGSLSPSLAVPPMDLSNVTAAIEYEHETHKTIIWQYSRSPIIKQLVFDFATIFDSTLLYDHFVQNIWDIRTAKDFGLDIWGRIVGVGRYLTLANDDYFGFEANFTPFDDKPFFHGSQINQQFRLNNNLYRKVILAKAANNISGSSIPEIENVLFLLFGDKGKSIVKITGFSELTYEFHFSPEPIDFAIINTHGLLPNPAGHTVIKTFV